MVTTEQNLETADPTNIVIFGAAGDLTKRKLIPSLVRMIKSGLVHSDSRIIGVVNNRTEEVWFNLIRESLGEFSPEVGMDEEKWAVFSSRMKMVPGDLASEDTYARLAESLESLGGRKNAMFYCAVPPEWYGEVANGLEKSGLVGEDEGYRRLVIEKPFGMDLETARALMAGGDCRERPGPEYRSQVH